MIPPEYFMEAQYPDPNSTEVWKVPVATRFLTVDLSNEFDTHMLNVNFNWDAATTMNNLLNKQPLYKNSLDMEAILKYWLRELNRFFFCDNAYDL